jgi:hypothetical protein
MEEGGSSSRFIINKKQSPDTISHRPEVAGEHCK